MKKVVLVLLSVLLIGCSASQKPQDQQATESIPTVEGSTTTDANNQIGNKGNTLTNEFGTQITLNDVIITNEYSVNQNFLESSENGNFVLTLLTIYNGGNSEITVSQGDFTFLKEEKEYSSIAGSKTGTTFNDYEYNGNLYHVPNYVVYNNGNIQPEETKYYLIICDLNESTSNDSELIVRFEDDSISYSEPLFTSFYVNK